LFQPGRSSSDDNGDAQAVGDIAERYTLGRGELRTRRIGGQATDPGEFALNHLGQHEGVEARSQFLGGLDTGQIALAESPRAASER
jgi:hypothetical protein